MSLVHVPLNIDEANALVMQWHRHHRPMPGARFALGAAKDGQLVGVALVGRPVSRMLDDGRTVEVNRLATDGTRNACSFLYGRARRAAHALGYTRIITYTLPAEGGASLRAAGFRLVHLTSGGQWGRDARPRVDVAGVLAGQKFLWEQSC